MHLVSNNFIYKKADKQRHDQRGDKRQKISSITKEKKITL